MSVLRFSNPFHDLWLTETHDAADYVRLFSTVLVTETEALFSAGNIVLKGRQGSGKSMLLALLDTSMRLAYARDRSVDYPVPAAKRKFISAGVNLVRENAALIAGRLSELPEAQRASAVAVNFADYLNTLLSIDLLRNIELLRKAQRDDASLIPEVQICLDTASEQRLVSELQKSESGSFFGCNDAHSYGCIQQALMERLRQHKLYFNFSIDVLPSSLVSSRMPAGEPIAVLAESLKASGILPKDTLVFLRIDQHEEIYELERKTGIGPVCRQVINAAMARRDSRLSYRIGSRHYAWEGTLAAWGSGAPLEEARDYHSINLDQILGRRENSKGWLFPELADDVLKRRLALSGFSVRASENSVELLFGRTLDPSERALRYAGTTDSNFFLEPDLSEEARRHLQALWKAGQPLDAWLGAAWLRQRAQVMRDAVNDPALFQSNPWREKQWWIKERNELALLQIAGKRQQALIWSGARHVIDLSGYNILAFMTICRSVWSTWLRRHPKEAETRKQAPSFEVEDQLIGISDASQTWFRKLSVGLEGDQRTRFIGALGGWFRRTLMSDRALSNPGHSGFSLEEVEILSNHPIIAIIQSCRDHGDLLESPHTTKLKNQRQRRKWYLHPLLCPYFRLQHIRTKEPIYTTAKELEGIYLQSKPFGPEVRDEKSVGQLDLFSSDPLRQEE